MKSLKAAIPFHYCLLLLLFTLPLLGTQAQMITGVWQGKLNGQRVEVKIIQKGDSLTGTSYYYPLGGGYSRYSIKGYFDSYTNEAVWWDDQLIEEKGALLNRGKGPLLSVADFNCPGGGRMFLEGKTAEKDQPDGKKGRADLTKGEDPRFPDEWDYVIQNYLQGTNHPYVIDSVAQLAFSPGPKKVPVPPEASQSKRTRPGMVSIPSPPGERPAQREVVVSAPTLRTPPTIEEAFIARQKVVATEIPVAGDSIELQFYDNAEIDGDSISLFLDGRLLFRHIRLSDQAFTLKLPTEGLQEVSELVMVAENLGTIPPNTSYMVAVAGGLRYEARLASTENSSAAIRLRRPFRAAAQKAPGPL